SVSATSRSTSTRSRRSTSSTRWAPTISSSRPTTRTPTAHSPKRWSSSSDCPWPTRCAARSSGAIARGSTTSTRRRTRDSFNISHGGKADMAHAYQTDQYEGMIAETVTMKGPNGDTINAYVARPLGKGPFPGMVVIHHAPGWDEWYRECTRKFAHHGYVAISPNLYFRDGHGTAEDVGAKVRAAGGAPDARGLGDLEGANSLLRSLPYVSRKIGGFGTCSGGRRAVLAGPRLKGLDAVIASRGRPGGHGQGRAHADPAGGAHRVHQGPVGAGARALRQRRQGADAGAGESARSGAEEARQELRVPPLRRRRPRLLLLRPGGVPAG